jgi:hypothetical protein
MSLTALPRPAHLTRALKGKGAEASAAAPLLDPRGRLLHNAEKKRSPGAATLNIKNLPDALYKKPQAVVRVKTPDALQLAAALAFGCTAYLTNDRTLPPIPGLRVLQLRDYVKPAGS